MSKNYMHAMLESSHLSAGSAAYVDGLFESFLNDPNSVPPEWQQVFSQLPKKSSAGDDVSHEKIRQEFLNYAKHPSQAAVAQAPLNLVHEKKQAHVLQMINAYRLHGHHHAKLDPLNKTERRQIPDLKLSHYGFIDSDLDTKFSTESQLTGNGAKLRDIATRLEDTYCSTIGVEYMHITDPEETTWIQNRLESVHGNIQLSSDEKIRILKHLTAAEGLEKYLGTRYVGQKRFSLEGGDSLVPMMHTLINLAGKDEVREMVIGMAHRGRLNMLVNVLGKSPAEMFQEFEGKMPEKMSGDVKYHLGFSSNVETPSGETLHLALAFNPSHLEIISPVVEGSVRSRQRRREDLIEKKKVIPVLIHGDAAFAGQGVVMETFNFSQARGYSTGGSVHIVINNQIGFTTSNPLDARSTLYCTDIAKIVQAPIFHVNGDDPEACVFVTQLAFDFRMRFKRDVVIDLVCYRRHGHNEADEPSVTQPWMYSIIKKLKTTREQYADKLDAEGVISKEKSDELTYSYRDALDKGDAIVKTVPRSSHDKYVVDWKPFLGQEWTVKADTSVPLKTLKQLFKRLDRAPNGFTHHPVIKRLLDERRKMAEGELPINWGFAENLAYATLLEAGYPVRLSGQDCGRGTFAHRHAVLHDYKTAEVYIPLEHISEKQSQFIVIDSVLSEEAVLGFEYGYASAEPNALVLWEAQFGDFANGAQVVIDQFISSGEQKWGRLCGLVMLLPHGFEGQGPEHSSARLERYLQLCAQHNMQVCVPTTPAQIYHLLRRQVVRPFRKPLIVMTPKSLLRHKLAVSTLEDLALGEFQLVIDEVDKLDAKKVKRVVMCSGKIYYDLLQQRRENKQKDVAIIRIEQLYPFPKKALKEVLKPFVNAKKIIWCQEEPQNQGAWFSSQHNMRACLDEDQSLRYVGRGFYKRVNDRNAKESAPQTCENYEGRGSS